MIEVVKHGNRIKTIECSECRCVYNYNIDENICEEYYNPYKYTTEHVKLYDYVKCPECGNKNKVNL